MQIATIVPTIALDLVENDEYHLCLVQELRKRGKYFEFYKRMAQEGKFVIVDNGAAEGETASIEEVHELAVEIGASEVQLPDVFFDARRTLDESRKGLEYLHKKGWKGKIMAIPQGSDLLAWEACLEELVYLEGVTTIGLPKNLVLLGGDNARLKILVRWMIGLIIAREVDAHLLGVWKDPREITKITTLIGILKFIRGVDSGIAAIYTQAGLLLDPEKHEKPGKNQAYLNFDSHDIDLGLLWRNIRRWRGYCEAKLR